MKISTRLVILLALVMAQASSWAATATIATGKKLASVKQTATAQRSNVVAWQWTPSGAPAAATRPAAQATAPTLSVYPNPSRGFVTVSFDQKASDIYKLRFSNIIGREVRMVALKPELNVDGLQINLSDLPAGVYFYSLIMNDKVVSTKRLILQN